MIELHVLASDARSSLGKLRQVELNQRQRLRAVVAQNGGVDFASLDILLDQRRAVEFLVNEVNALHQLFHAIDNGAVVDPDRSVFGNGLDDQRKLNVVGVFGAALV